MPKKRLDRPPEYILCGNPAHGIPRTFKFIAEHFRLSPADIDPAVPVHHSWNQSAPFGTFLCHACGHYTGRHRGPEPMQ